MRGFEFGYAILIEQCYQMLVLAPSITNRKARNDVQCTALKCITAVFHQYCIDFTGSQVARVVLEFATPAAVALWVEKRYHEVPVEAGKHLVRLALCNAQRDSVNPIRLRIDSDFGGENGVELVPSAPRNANDILQSEVDIAAMIFEPIEVLNRVAANETTSVHLAAWLRVLARMVNCDF